MRLRWHISFVEEVQVRRFHARNKSAKFSYLIVVRLTFIQADFGPHLELQGDARGRLCLAEPNAVASEKVFLGFQ